jgi:hypothetical protein
MNHPDDATLFAFFRRTGTDGPAWAAEFCRNNPGAVDEGLLATWFANAIVIAQDTVRRDMLNMPSESALRDTEPNMTRAIEAVAAECSPEHAGRLRACWADVRDSINSNRAKLAAFYAGREAKTGDGNPYFDDDVRGLLWRGGYKATSRT